MTSPALPLDVLLLIAEISPQRTVARMTRTCRVLREGGARLLLDGGVSLTTGKNLISFLRFLKADPSPRFQHLRSLEIACGELQPKAVDALLGLITHPLLALDSLTLREAESMLRSKQTPSRHSTKVSDPATLVAAFAALMTLENLSVAQCDQRACSLISTIQSPLKSISIDFTPLTSWHRSDDAEDRNPIVLLANVSDTLEEISGSNFAMHPQHVRYDVVYPSVRKINAYNSESVSIPGTLAYITAFPNLTHLSLVSSHSNFTGWLDTPAQRTLLDSLRSSNMENQERHKRTWKHLEEVSGTTLDVLALGLTCRVPRLRLTGAILTGLIPHVKTVLNDTRPTSLAITVAGASLFQDETIAGVLREPSAQQVKTLEMELCFSPSEGEVDVQVVLNDVARTLALLPVLSHLTLTLNCGLLTGPIPSHRSRYGWFCPAEEALDGLDLEATGALFRAAILSLEDVAVHLSKDRACHEYMLGAVGDSDSVASSGSGSLGSESAVEMEADFGNLLMEEDDDGW